MNEVKLKDKNFEIFINEKEINDIISNISNRINDSGIVNPLFIAILNGSFLFASIKPKINIK